jgi:hypothetical protein
MYLRRVALSERTFTEKSVAASLCRETAPPSSGYVIMAGRVCFSFPMLHAWHCMLCGCANDVDVDGGQVPGRSEQATEALLGACCQLASIPLLDLACSCSGFAVRTTVIMMDLHRRAREISSASASVHRWAWADQLYIASYVYVYGRPRFVQCMES